MMLRVPEVKACAKEHGVTVTELLCAAMMQAIDHLQAEKVPARSRRKPVKVTVPVNLRGDVYKRQASARKTLTSGQSFRA